MLQDLDARGGNGARQAAADVRPVAAGHTSRTAIAVGAGIGVLIVAAGAGAWYYLNRPAPVPLAPPVPAVVLAPAAPVVVAPAAAVVDAPAATAPVAAPEPDPTVPSEATPQAPATGQALTVPAGAAVPAAREAPQARPAVPRTPRADHADRAERAERAERAVAPERVAEPPAGQGATLTSQQQGENAYRRALAALQEGRLTEGVAALEHAVQAYPRHEAARQTLVGLLLENGRADEAMRHAQLGLGLDANQPQLAMVLARLQLERGGAADATLLRSLPHAAGDADYIAFLAGVLQKQGRHREAVAQYEAALRLRPANGVWWMGLGISLQAENLRTNAREAYQKARAAGLSPALQEFVERRLAQVQ
ncbi:tetratricopeptide repeat protein [Massilia dura]|uniref:Tetratricopeptide repeat protein n=1 Tax=Pseudoduganella dura TaxID=321982 RepID=A0A6I3XT90_9BURK|nr:tetratricopeptide repeat protein [Pseudoduganella dura]MUI16502.1 tetratricopeptide repeat protein [Pseudoduganella dura]GGX87305.1 hypothetical protein GCM10007386_17730 [Pseudoduganella dura]